MLLDSLAGGRHGSHLTCDGSHPGLSHLAFHQLGVQQKRVWRNKISRLGYLWPSRMTQHFGTEVSVQILAQQPKSSMLAGPKPAKLAELQSYVVLGAGA